MPDYGKIAKAYEIEYKRYSNDNELPEEEFKNICNSKKGPTVIEIFVKPNTTMYPRVSSGKFLEKYSLNLPGIALMDPKLPDHILEDLLLMDKW